MPYAYKKKSTRCNNENFFLSRDDGNCMQNNWNPIIEIILLLRRYTFCVCVSRAQTLEEE